MIFGVGFASAMTALFAAGLMVFAGILNLLSRIFSWGIERGINTQAEAGDGRQYERIPWDGGDSKASEVRSEINEIKRYTFLQQCAGVVAAIAILAAACYCIYFLNGVIGRIFGKWIAFGWMIAILVIAMIASTISRIFTMRTSLKVPPEFSPRFALKKSVIAFDPKNLRIYMGDPEFPPRIFDLRKGDITAYELLGGDADPGKSTAGRPVAKIRVNLNSVRDPMRIVGFEDVDSAVRASQELDRIFDLAAIRS